MAGGGAAPAPRRARLQKGRLTGDKTRYTPSPAGCPTQHPGGGRGLQEAVGEAATLGVECPTPALTGGTQGDFRAGDPPALGS